MFAQSRGLFDLPAADKAAMPFNGTLDIGYLGSGGQALDEESGMGPLTPRKGFMLTNNGVFEPGFELDAADPLRGATLFWPPAHAAARLREGHPALHGRAHDLNHRLNALLFAAVGLGDAERLAPARLAIHGDQDDALPARPARRGRRACSAPVPMPDWGSL